MSKVVKGVTRAVSKVVKGVATAVKKVASSKIGKIIMVAAAVYFGGAALLGAMGSTGFSTGPHLHFEIRPNGGSAIDPMAFLASAKR